MTLIPPFLPFFYMAGTPGYLELLVLKFRYLYDIFRQVLSL